jgi:phosphoribosyl 1,2-cyclic phosphodiesterase
MSLRLCVLASGSSGNCIFVGSESTRILIDAGISGARTRERLSAVGIEMDSIDAICLTHEHDDHRSSLAVLHRRTGAQLYANSATIDALERGGKCRDLTWNVFTTGEPFSIGDVRMEPFSVPHDSYDPVGFIVTCGGVSAGIVTDMGMATGLIRERLRGCHALVLESNHDEQMLRDADRPWALKQRIAGRQGHLSNQQAATLLREIAGSHLQSVLLAHLSSECNRPHLADRAVRKALELAGCAHVSVSLTYADRPSAVVDVRLAARAVDPG